MMLKYLRKNMYWQFHQQPFANLLCAAVTERQLYAQAEKLADKYYPEHRRVDVTETEFCLNKIALSKPRTAANKIVVAHFAEMWAQFVRLKNLFGKKYMTFPAESSVTRVEQLAQLLARCTQFAASETLLRRITARAAEIIDLTEREARYLPDVVQLYKLKFVCAAYFDQRKGAAAISRMFEPQLLKDNFAKNVLYRQCAYATDKLTAVIDCMGESAVKTDVTANGKIKLFVYANGRNVFDTFCESRFGEKTAEFRSDAKSVRVEMKYFVLGECEVRKLSICNKGKTARKFTIDVPLCAAHDGNAQYFKMGNALCLAGDIYCAVAIVHDNAVVACDGEQSRTFTVTIAAGGCYNADIVCLYCRDTPTLAEKIAQLERLGSTRCPFADDRSSAHVQTNNYQLSLTPHGYVMYAPQKILSERLQFTYQLGNNDVATFVDNGGTSTTLLGGFAFGVRGESVYCVRNGLITKLNEGAFCLEGDKVRYSKAGGMLTLGHGEGKIYDIEYTSPCKTLLLFTFADRSKVAYDSKTQTFAVTDERRSYKLRCEMGRVESYTTNALETNSEKLRYKLSGDLTCGDCLALCIAAAGQVKVALLPDSKLPEPSPIVRESLVSTYLNYINNKNVFCIANRLKRVDSLTLAAICYTNAQFVKQRLADMLVQAACEYYDSAGRLRSHIDPMAFPLSCVYYLSLAGELPQNVTKAAVDALFGCAAVGKTMCVKALALLKAGRLDGFDKVRCLLEYNNLKNVIIADEQLYGYAQAIGALPMTEPSKEKLRQLCNKYDVPKCWYYVSQLENLYGLQITCGRLHISPVASVLPEQLALNVCGKKINTTFAKAAVRSLTLNGVQYYQPFCPQNLLKSENQLVVRY